MVQSAARNQVVAGAFILLAAAGAVAILVLVGGEQAWFQPKQLLLVHFASAPNLKVGSPVLLAGHPLGRVQEIHLVEHTCPPRQKLKGISYEVEVVAQLPAKYVVYKDAKVVMVQSLVGQSAALNIKDVGVKEALEAGVPLFGKQESAFADAADELGIGEKEQASVKQIIENLELASGNIEEVSYKARIAIEEVNGILGDNRRNIADTIAHAKSVSDKLDADGGAILANAKSVSEKLEEQGSAILANAKAATKKIDEMIDENRPDVRAAIANTRSATDKVEKSLDEIIANVKAGSNDLKSTLADLRTLSGDTKDVVVWNKGNLNKTFQNFKDTSEHLKALAQEVRRAPWRLFGTPDKKEVESLNLYDAARSFATAASDLEGLSDTLRAMMEAREKGVAVNAAVLQGMADRLQDTFNHYQEAEEALWKEFDRIQK